MIASIHPRRYDQGILETVRRFEYEGRHTRIAEVTCSAAIGVTESFARAMKPR
jgi:hypothetical protein